MNKSDIVSRVAAQSSLSRAIARDLAGVEPEFALDRFDVHGLEILGDKRNR